MCPVIFIGKILDDGENTSELREAADWKIKPGHNGW